MIRRAELTDVLTILQEAVVFNDTYYQEPLNITKALNHITAIVEDGVAFVADGGGFIGGILVDDPVRDALVLVEVAWYSTATTGIRLLKAFIAEGRRLQAREVRMTTLNTSPEAAAVVLRRSGFTLREISHSLIL